MGTAREHVDYLTGRMPMVESPRGSNRVPICEEFGPIGTATAYAWCCATQAVACRELGTPFVMTAAVAIAIDAAKRGDKGMKFLDRDATIRVGDMPTYDYGPFHGEPPGNPARFHINCVVNPSIQSKYQAIGGNESDSLRLAFHTREFVMGFIRPAYTAAVAGPVPEEDDMPFKQIGITKPGSQWVKDNMHVPNKSGHAVMMYESGIVRHIDDPKVLEEYKQLGVKVIGEVSDAKLRTYTYAAQRLT
jgi:hypothetical protein